MHKILRLGALLVAGLGSSHVAGQIARADASSDKTIDRAQFIQVTRIVQLPADRQAASVPQLYELLAQIPRGRTYSVSSILYMRVPWRTPDHEKLTPEAQADLVEKQGTGQYLADESGILVCQTLKKYPDLTTLLIRDDLRSDDATRQYRGLNNINALMDEWGHLHDADLPEQKAQAIPFASFYPDIARIFASAPPAKSANEFGISNLNLSSPGEPPLKTQAENALLNLRDARAIALLIADDAAQPLLHYDAIYRLAYYAPGDVALQTLAPFLHSNDATSRYRALYALPISLPAVRAALPVLIDDPDTQVRAWAVFKAFQLEAPEFAALETRLKSKLADDSPRVRWMVADGFAGRKNPIAAPVLLALLRNQTPDVNSWAVGDELYRLTGLNQNYSWPQNDANNPDDTRRNAEATARVEAWIAAHPAQ